MQWQRLDRDNSIKVIESVKSEANAGLFSVGTSEVKRARLPFYDSYFLYKMTNFASLPSFSFQYLGDGQFFHYLDGTEDPIYSVNEKSGLNISESTVLLYLQFFLEQTGSEDGDIILINNPQDMPLLDSLDIDVYQAVFSEHKPPKVALNEDGNGYTVTADLYTDSQLVRARIEITGRGKVKIVEQKMIMHQMRAADMAETMV